MRKPLKKPTTKYVIAIDPGLDMGVAFKNLSTGEVGVGNIKFEGATISGRLNHMYEFLTDWLGDDNCVAMVVEAVNKVRAMKFTHDHTFCLQYCFGHCHVLSYKKGTPLLAIPPTTLKKMTTGSGKATKHQVRESVNKHYNTNVRNLNASDALGLLWCWELSEGKVLVK